MAIFKKREPESFTHRYFIEQGVKVSRKNAAAPAFSKLRSKIYREDKYALDLFNQYIADKAHCQKIINDALKDAKDLPLSKLPIAIPFGKGYGTASACASAALIPINQSTAMNLPMDVLWNYIFNAGHDWWGFTMVYNCRVNGTGGEWTAWAHHLRRRDLALTTYVNPKTSIPLPKQLDFVGAMLKIMDSAKIVMAFRIVLEIAKLTDPKAQQDQFDKMAQFLFPDVVFRDNPSSFTTSTWLNDEQRKVWTYMSQISYANLEKLDMSITSDYDAIRNGRMRDWALKACRFLAPPKDTKEYATYDPKQILDTIWEELCVPIMKKDREMALQAKTDS